MKIKSEMINSVWNLAAFCKSANSLIEEDLKREEIESVKILIKESAYSTIKSIADIMEMLDIEFISIKNPEENNSEVKNVFDKNDTFVPEEEEE